jgi:hypothetical protein
MYIYYYKYVCIHTLHITYTHIPRGSSPPTRPYIYIYMYIYIYVYIYIYIHTYIHTSRVLATLPRTRPHIYIYIYKLHITYTFVPRGSLPRTRAHIYIYLYTYIIHHIYIHTSRFFATNSLCNASVFSLCARCMSRRRWWEGEKRKKKFLRNSVHVLKKSTCRALFRICLPGAWSQKALQKIEGKKNKELVCLVPGRKGDKNKIK